MPVSSAAALARPERNGTCHEACKSKKTIETIVPWNLIQQLLMVLEKKEDSPTVSLLELLTLISSLKQWSFQKDLQNFWSTWTSGSLVAINCPEY